MKTVPLTKGKFALVDDADYEAVSQFKWYAVKIGRRFYAIRPIRKPDGQKTTQYMHRFLMPGVAEVDHIDGDGLNNSREKNLRSVTRQQNLQGFQRQRLGKTSKFRGVCWCRTYSKWLVRIKVDRRNIHVGYFEEELDAARARDAAARKYFGEGASLNFNS